MLAVRRAIDPRAQRKPPRRSECAAAPAIAKIARAVRRRNPRLIASSCFPIAMRTVATVPRHADMRLSSANCQDRTTRSEFLRSCSANRDFGTVDQSLACARAHAQRTARIHAIADSIERTAGVVNVQALPVQRIVSRVFLREHSEAARGEYVQR